MQSAIDVGGLGHDSRTSVEPNPPELLPILLVVVDEDGDHGVVSDVSQAFEVGGPFGFGVDREVESLLVDSKADRHYVWPQVRARRRQTRDARRRDPAPHFGRVHERSLALSTPKRHGTRCGYR